MDGKRSRAALGGCAVATLLGAGLLIAPGAHALEVPGVATVTVAPTATVSALDTVPTTGDAGSASSGSPAAPSASTGGVAGATDALAGATGSVAGATGDLAGMTGDLAGTTGDLAGTTGGATGDATGAVDAATDGTTAVPTVIEPVVSTANDLPTAGTGVPASVTSDGSGGVTAVVGGTADGGSLATVHLGAGDSVTATGTATLPVQGLADAAAGTAATATGTAAAATGTAAAGATGSAASTASAPGGTATGAAGPHLLSLDVTPSLGTVYPVKDGYRDSVLFRLGAVTSDDAVAQLTGTAVLRRNGAEVARWRFTRSSQALRWDGRDHGKVRAGVYSLTVSAKDVLGAVFQDRAKVSVSKKRLVATTRSVTSSATSGARRMWAPAAAGLARGRVTVVIRTVASGVRGTQSLVFTKGGRKLVVPVRNGVHVSREITVPSSFSTFTVSHTWKKGAVKLKSVRYRYTYQALQ